MGEAIFKAVLRLYPARFRHRYGSEQMEFFRQERAALGTSPGSRRLIRFWARTLIDSFLSVLRVRVGSLRSALSAGGPGRNGGPGPGRTRRRSFTKEVLQDVRYALRTLGRKPGFVLVATGVMGLGTGAATTLFSAVNGVLLKPLPYPEQERLVFIGSRYPGSTAISQMSVPELMDVMAETRSLEAFAASRGGALDLVGDGQPERVAFSRVTPDYFRVLGTSPAIGRGFSRADFQASGARVILLSDGLWRRRFGGDPGVVGKTILASDGTAPAPRSYVVIGVLPAGFENPPPLENPFSRLPPSELWAPLPLNAEDYAGLRTNWTVRTVARLRAGASLEALNAELQILALALREAYPEVHVRGDTYLGLGARSLLDEMVGSRKLDLLTLLGATGLLLLISCANVAGLLAARAPDRASEIRLRTALGAGRVRLFRQLLTESLVLAVPGGAAGTGLAFLGIRAFRILGPSDFPRLADVTLNPRVLAFGLVLAGITGILFGTGPAISGSRASGGSDLLSTARGGTSGRRTLRFRGGLVALEVALALVLLMGFGLLSRSVFRLQSVDLGIEAGGLALMQVRLPPSYDQEGERKAFFSELRDRLSGLPGVISVSHIADPPMGFNQWSPSLWRLDDLERRREAGSGNAHRVGREYFRTVGIPVLRGRDFTSADDEGAPRVAVVSRSLAENLWPGEDPLGKPLGLSVDEEGPWVRVVGVVGDIRQGSLQSRPARDIYLPYRQDPDDRSVYMVVRTARGRVTSRDALREAVWAIDRNIPIPEVTTMKARVAATLRLPRFRTFRLASFAGVALLLAAAGIYGTLMYTVGRHTREVGIRMALGAPARDVVLGVVRQGMTPVVVGVLLGVAGSLATTRVLKTVLFEISPNDPSTLGLVAGVLVGVSLVASCLPALRACRIDPGETLRAD